MQLGFDHSKYLEEQSKFILERVNSYDKLYIEFGGKLLFDFHAQRVLPGYDENAKIELLHHLRDKVEVIICFHCGDIERNKIRGDFGITYDIDVLKMIDDLRSHELNVNSVVVTRYEPGASIDQFITKLGNYGIRVYKHTFTKGYPTDVETIVSDEGYGKNPFIETTKPIVVVTAPGPGSGKLGTCLSQLYHEYKRGNKAGYSKFETFPVWDVPLRHPLNIAYEAATTDLKDINIIDPFHLETYGKIATNYNRDIEAFPLLKRIIEKITEKDSVFKSPTDMGVNRISYGIIDDEIIKQASMQEIIRRFFQASCDYKKGYIDNATLQRSRLLMEELNLKETDRAVVSVARDRLQRQKDNDGLHVYPVTALELPDGSYVTGKGSALMNATAALILNAIKTLAGIADDIHLISPVVLEPIVRLKKISRLRQSLALSSEEVLIALSISAATNPVAMVAMDKLALLKGCQAHSTTILAKRDEQAFRNLGIDVTCDPDFPTENLYYV